MPDTPVAVSRARGEWVSDALSRVRVRHFDPLIVDEPAAEGGGDTGPRPTEYLMVAYAGCTAVIAERVAREMAFSYDALQTDLRGALDPRGIEGQPEHDPHIHTVTGWVRVTTREPDERLQRLAGEVERRCPLYQMLVRSGTRVEVNWRRVEAEPTGSPPTTD